MRGPHWHVLGVLSLGVWLTACAPAPAGTPTSPAAPAASAAGAGTPTAAVPVRVGFANVTAVHAPLWTALEGGAFARQGLAVELVNLGPSQATQAALLAGEAPVASVSGSSTLNVLLAGGDLVIIGAVFDTMPYQLVANRDIATLAELQGKTIGVNRFGGAADFVLRYLLRQQGIDPDTQVSILQVGAQRERLAALRGGGLHATLVDPPFQTIAEREGLRILVDTAELNIPYPQDVVVVSREWLRTSRDLARRVLAGILEGGRQFHEDRELGERALRRWLQLDDARLVRETYDYFQRYIPAEPLPRPEGLQLVIDEVGTTHPEARSMRPQDLVDPSLIAELARP
jgi:NitT/TauT family transport system substrate-binding protein